MSLIRKIATAGAVAAMGLGLGAASASAAIDLSPNPFQFTGNQTTQNVFTAGGAPVFCDTAQFTGNTANSTTTEIPFRAFYDDCQLIIAGIPFDAEVTIHSDWVLTYVSGNAEDGVTAHVDILDPGTGPAVEIHVPDFPGCVITVEAQDTLSHVVAENDPFDTAVNITATVTGIEYTQQNCPVLPSSGNDATYDGGVTIPDITITDV